MFIVLSPWQSYCKSSLSSRGEYRTALSFRRPLDQTNPLEPHACLAISFDSTDEFLPHSVKRGGRVNEKVTNVFYSRQLNK